MDSTLQTSKQRLRHRLALPRLQRGGLLRATSLLVAGDTLAKVLAFLFFVYLARVVSPAVYGIFRTSLTVGYFGSVPAAALALTLMHELARPPDDTHARRIAAAMSLSLVGSALGIAVALAAAFGGTTIIIGTALIILGLAFAYTYLGVNKGTQEFAKTGAYPAVSNLLQLIPLGISALWFPRYVLIVAMASYGLSYFVTLLPFEWLKPVPRPLPLRGWRRAELKSTLGFAAPLFVSHGAYQLLFGLDLIWLALFAGAETVGYYAAAKALVTAYAVIPNALYSVLLPKTSAEGAGGATPHNLKLALLLAALADGALILFFGVSGPLLLNKLFGAGYERAALPLAALGIGMLFYALCMVLSAHATGLGAPRVQGAALLLGLLAAAAMGPLLTPRLGMLGASASFVCGTFVAFLVAAAWSRRLVRRSEMIGFE